MKETTKRVEARMQNVNFDCTSSLPDELLILVLSFLTTKEAVQTCILSKRWRKFWVNLPILKFNVNEFGVDDSIGASDKASRTSITRFYQFVNGVVENLESTHIESVSYVHDTKPAYSNYKVPMQWLDRVALLMPQLIDISIAKVKSIELPDSLFACATLQHLEIKLFQVKETTIMPTSINLPSLKVFDLRGMGIGLHDNFAQNLLMGCPSLETLKLFSCMLHFSIISSNTLKELHIGGCHQCEPIQISCPSLFSLRIGSYLHGGANISLKNMKFLKIATFALRSVAQHFGGGDVPVLNFLGGLSNATKLVLYIQSPELKFDEGVEPKAYAFALVENRGGQGTITICTFLAGEVKDLEKAGPERSRRLRQISSILQSATNKNCLWIHKICSLSTIMREYVACTQCRSFLSKI